MKDVEFRVFNKKEQYSVTKEEELWICQAFSLLNSLASDSSSKRDVKKAFSALGFNPTDEEVKSLIDKIKDGDDNGNVMEFNQFFNLMKARLLEHQCALEMKGVFSIFDMNGNARIDADTIKRLLATIGEQMDNAEIEDMIAEADTNNDGVVTEEDFMRLLKRTKFWRR